MNDTEFLFELSRVEGKLMSHAMALTGHSVDDAQELYQATVVRAYIKKELFAPGTTFSFWMERVMKNIYLNECTAAHHRLTVRNDDCSGYFDFTSDCCGADEQFEFNEGCSIIESLPAAVATPLRMYARGYKYNEIADALNLPMSSVKNRIRAARIYLKRILER